MSAKLHLGRSDAFDRLEPMVGACHLEMAIESDPDKRRAGLRPLLSESPYGAVYLIGPQNAPVGYLVVTFSWSIEVGGLEASIDELWVRPSVRRRGMAREAIEALVATLKTTDVRAVSLETELASPAAAMYRRLNFEPRERHELMSLML